MTHLERLKARFADGENYPEVLLLDALESAKHVILERRFPFGRYPAEVEARYEDLQYRIALELLGRVGAEGQVSHSANGVARVWSDDISLELDAITPMASVI